MRGLAWLLGLAALAVGIALAARGNEGYVLIVWPPYRIELTLNLLLVGLLLAFFVGYAALRALLLTLALPQRVREFHAARRKDKASLALQAALRLFYEGRYGHALKRATQAFDAGHAPGLSALLAARAAHALREPEKEAAWLARAGSDAEVAAAWLMSEAELAVESRRFDDALQALQRVQGTTGRHIAALRLELKAQQGLRHWDEVLRLTRQLEKRGAMLAEQAREIKLRAHRENLRLRQADAGQLLAYLRQVPASETGPRLAAVVAEALLAAGSHAQALKVIATQLEQEWDAALVKLYGECEQGIDGDDESATAERTVRLARAEKWLTRHPRDGELLLALGRLCVRQRLWGKAQSYLEASLSVHQSRAAHLELARLCEQLGRAQEADRHYRLGAKI
jgi:HemY protein